MSDPPDVRLTSTVAAPLVSVIIPCYNQARFLGEALEFVLRQTYRPVEVIVVDDGATDDTAEVAAQYAGIQCLRQTNQGLSAARNSGLRAGRGQYVVFLDADDRLLPGALEAGAASLDAQPEAAFAVGVHRCIDAGGQPLPVRDRPRIDRDHYTSLIRRCWISMPATVMYRRAALETAGGFDTTRRYAEDYDMYLRLTRRFPVVDHYAPVAEYRQHHGTLSRSAAPMLAATLAVLRSHRPGAGAAPAHRAAYRARDNAVWYFERLLESSLDDLKHRRWRLAARAFLVFARHLPQHPRYALWRLGTPLRLAGRALRRRPSGTSPP